MDELVVDNDPEYQWMDNFRQARTSNESRQSLLYKLDATVRRQLGKKVCMYISASCEPSRCCCWRRQALNIKLPRGKAEDSQLLLQRPGGRREATRS